MLPIATHLDLKLFHMNLDRASLNGELDIDI